MKIKSKACRLFLLVAFLMAVLLLPQPGLAQAREGDLTLTLFSGRYSYYHEITPLREIDLTLTLFSGRYSYYHEVTPGKDNSFNLEIRNTGSKAITNIRLSSDKPEGWVIDLELEEIDYLGPGSLLTVDVNIKPAPKAAKGEYRVIFTAKANEILTEHGTWVTVKAASFWPWIGAGVVLVVVAGFIFIFMRFGRQK
jgi:uncharacterized membrane protein